MAAVSDLLVVVVELSEGFLASSSLEPPQQLSAGQCLDSAMTLCNSHLLLSPSNRVAVCLAHQAGSQFVCPSLREVEEGGGSSGKYEPLAQMNAVFEQDLQKAMQLLAESPVRAVSQGPLLAGALSKALCYIHRQLLEAPVHSQLRARILVLGSSDSTAAQYVSTMNCIFAAQKKSIPIDACMLWAESGFLQQACDITGGLYLSVPEPAGLLQFLLWVYLSGVAGREHLVLPSAMQVSYHCACFCHHKLIEVGFVCSVCLSIFCQFQPICSTCQTHFKRPYLPPTSKSKKKRNHKVNK